MGHCQPRSVPPKPLMEITKVHRWDEGSFSCRTISSPWVRWSVHHRKQNVLQKERERPKQPIQQTSDVFLHVLYMFLHGHSSTMFHSCFIFYVFLCISMLPHICPGVAKARGYPRRSSLLMASSSTRRL